MEPEPRPARSLNGAPPGATRPGAAADREATPEIEFPHRYRLREHHGTDPQAYDHFDRHGGRHMLGARETPFEGEPM